ELAKIDAHVKYLVCQTQCLWEEANLHLELPVQPPGTTPKPADIELFGRARKALPRLESERILITPKISRSSFKTGQTFRLTVAIDVAEGYYLQPHQLHGSNFTALDVFVKRIPEIYFDHPEFPEPRVLRDSHDRQISVYTNTVEVRVPAEVDENFSPKAGQFGGVVVFQACRTDGECHDPEAVAFTLDSGPDGKLAAAGADDESPAESGEVFPAGVTTGPADSSNGMDQYGLAVMLLFCFLYGLFINATPCVLPLLSIKVLGFVQQAHESRRRTLALGLAFGVGVIVFFIILGFLASAGKNVLQFPEMVIAFGAVVTAMALSMLGVYTLQVPTSAASLEARLQHEGLLSSFGKGALAPVLGFACTGPLLAGAFGWATQQPPQVAVLAFLCAGLGMASPYMILGANPTWLSFLPKPGNWMVTFERVMGFLLLIMVVYLISPLVQQIGATGLLWTMAFFVVIAAACAVLGKVDITMSPGVRWRYRGAAMAMAVTAALPVYGWIYPLGQAKAVGAIGSGMTEWETGIPWRPLFPETIEEVVRSGRPVFVDFTAAYCTVCKANKKLATNTPEVRDKMKSLGVVPFQADFTSADPRIAAILKQHGRAGVPLNLIYPANQPNNPIVLRPNLTKAYLLEKLDEVASPPTSLTTAPTGS
ncbi:MAG: thioredoxin family protein, partial [Planctomycetes bacterium]|nr:thioredoxin family protein [Planctomycetota bacterium]